MATSPDPGATAVKGRAIHTVILGLWTITLVLVAATAVLITVGRAPGWPSTYEVLAVAAETLAFGTAGALVAWRRPTILAGWMLLAVGLVWIVVAALYAYVDHVMAAGPGSMPAVRLATWVANWIWIFAFIALGLFFMLFPDDRLPGAPWRVIVMVGFVAGALLLAERALMPGPLAEFPGIDNQFGIAGGGPVLRVAEAVGNPLFAAVGTASVVSLFVRFRRADMVQRRQLLWMALAGAVFVALNGLADILRLLDVGIDVGNLHIGSFAAVPVAAAVAILKYRLYEIDRVISKTVVYGVLAAFVTTVFVLMVVGLGSVFGQGRANLPLSIVATAVVAVCFQPVRQRTQRVANRIVYGRRPSPYEVLAAFSRRIGEPVATEALLPEMARTLAEGTGATGAAVWLAVGSDLRRAAVWPEKPYGPQPLPLAGGDLPPMPEATRTVPVRHEGQLLGALTVTKAPDEQLTPAEDRLMSDLAAQVGLALRNVRLIEELKASRQRIVAAQDAERRRLERDIHDGAQQRLVTLSLALRMARGRPNQHAGLAAALDSASRELNDGLVELRELARGIHPAILSEEGLGPALASLSERSPIVTTVASPPAARLPAPIEATAYQVASHALTAATQAGASSAKISVEHAAGMLVLEVSNDATHAAHAPLQTSLPGLYDRVAALDGRLEVEAPSDRGTIVRAVIPCESY
jgi:signal transduction histidine kinase